MVRILIALAVLGSTVGASQAAEMKFYQLPSGSYPHDVAPAPDGTVWFSGQQQGFAGRFDVVHHGVHGERHVFLYRVAHRHSARSRVAQPDFFSARP